MRGQKVRTFTLKNLVEKKKSSRILRVEDSVIRVRVRVRDPCIGGFKQSWKLFRAGDESM